jgi:hypothetical protein
MKKSRYTEEQIIGILSGERRRPAAFAWTAFVF